MAGIDAGPLALHFSSTISIYLIGVLVAGAVAGFLSLPMAVLGHEISEFVVIGSGLRMLRG